MLAADRTARPSGFASELHGEECRAGRPQRSLRSRRRAAARLLCRRPSVRVRPCRLLKNVGIHPVWRVTRCGCEAKRAARRADRVSRVRVDADLARRCYGPARAAHRCARRDEHQYAQPIAAPSGRNSSRVRTRGVLKKSIDEGVVAEPIRNIRHEAHISPNKLRIASVRSPCGRPRDAPIRAQRIIRSGHGTAEPDEPDGGGWWSGVKTDALDASSITSHLGLMRGNAAHAAVRLSDVG